MSFLDSTILSLSSGDVSPEQVVAFYLSKVCFCVELFTELFTVLL